MKIIVGLGNPGKEYENTRHNVGFMYLDHLIEKYKLVKSLKKFNSIIDEIKIGSEKVLLVKPQTYMNLSGEAVQKIKNYYKLENEDILVVFDDIDIQFGLVRYRQNGSGGTHNGMKNIVQMLPGEDFPRIKIGIGNLKHDQQDLSNFVLSKFNEQEKETLGRVFAHVDEKLGLFLDNHIN